MQQAPNSYVPGGMTLYNGRPTYAQDAVEVDRAQTWLAASWKPLQPALVGAALDSTNTAPAIKFRVLLPPYTPHVAFGFLCTGRGTITVTSSGDTYNAVLVVDAADGTGVPSTHDLADALMIWLDHPVTGTGANGHERALDNALSSTYSERDITIAVTDKGGGETLKVHAVVPLALQPEAETLPA